MTGAAAAADPGWLLTHWGAYRAEVENGRLLALHPAPGDADPSPLGRSIPGALHDAARIAQPMVRAGYLKEGPASRARRGEEPFVAIPWDEAFNLAARELDRVRRDHGNGAIFGGSYGWASAGRFHHAQSQIHRFLNCCGGYVRSVNTHSYAAAEVLLPHVLGNHDGLDAAHTSWDQIAGHTRLFVAFGGLPLKNAQVAAGGVSRHRVRDGLAACAAAGLRFVNISPLRSDIDAAFAPRWIPVRPNSDVALMLGLAHTLVAEGLHDAAFLERYATGADRFLAYLTGEADSVAKSADWAAPLCGVAPDVIRALARDMAGTRTMIAVAWSLQRADHGEQPLWAAIALACLLGQIGLPGGGFGFGYGGSNRVGTSALGFSWPALPQGENAIADFIPVARLADMLLHPGEPYDYDGERRRYPDIRLVWWAGGNPFHHQQDLNRLREAWRRPDTVIAHEPWWNALARHADIVLPCTTPAERNDLGVPRGEAHFFAMRRAAEPFGEAKSDHAILAGIARRLGVAEAFTGGLDEMGWIRHLYALSRQRAAAHGLDLPDFDAFWRAGEVKLPVPATPPLFAAFRADPQAHALPTPSGRIEMFSERIASFGYADCPGHPVWLEPAEWLGGDSARRFPLHLVSNQPATRLHSQYDNGIVSREGKIAGREPVTLHPDDAARRGLRTGDVVRIFNDRGACLAGLVISDQIAPGVARLPTGAWWDPDGDLDRHGNPNAVTLDRGASRLSQAPIAHTTLVEIERWNGDAPPVRAFQPPPIAAA